MPLYQRDYDLAARYLQCAGELLLRDSLAGIASVGDMLVRTACRLSPGDTYAGDIGVEIQVLRVAVYKLKAAGGLGEEARKEILKAVYVLRDGASSV